MHLIPSMHESKDGGENQKKQTKKYLPCCKRDICTNDQYQNIIRLKDIKKKDSNNSKHTHKIFKIQQTNIHETAKSNKKKYAIMWRHRYARVIYTDY